MQKTSILVISEFFLVCREASHNGAHKGKMSIFFAGTVLNLIFFSKFESFFKFFWVNFLPAPAFRICSLFAEMWFDLLKIGFKNTYIQIFPGFPAISELCPILGQIWVNFCQKGPYLNFCQKNETGIFRLQRLGFVQKIRKFQSAVSKKMIETAIFGHFDQIWVYFGQNGPIRDHFRIFGEKMKTSPSYTFF